MGNNEWAEARDQYAVADHALRCMDQASEAVHEAKHPPFAPWNEARGGIHPLPDDVGQHLDDAQRSLTAAYEALRVRFPNKLIG